MIQHLQVASVLNYSALVFNEMKKFDKGLPLHQRALQIYKEKCGDSSLEVASTLDFLGAVNRNMKQYETAHKMHDQALSILVQKWGDDHEEARRHFRAAGSVF